MEVSVSLHFSSDPARPEDRFFFMFNYFPPATYSETGIHHNVAARPSPITSPRQQVLQRHPRDSDRKRGGEKRVRVGGEGGMNESYSYAFSFTSIRIHNWEEGEGDRRGGVEQEGMAAHSCLH